MIKSLKKGWDNAFLAVIRSLGSYSSNDLIRCTTSVGAELLIMDAIPPLDAGLVGNY